MIKRIIFAAAVVIIVQSASIAQVQMGSPSHATRKTDEVLTASKHHVEKGEACLSAGDVECARREFDSAVDEYIELGVDLRSDELLLASWREMIQKINR